MLASSDSVRSLRGRPMSGIHELWHASMLIVHRGRVHDEPLYGVWSTGVAVSACGSVRTLPN